MLRRSTELPRWLLLAGLLCCSSCQSVPFSFENKTGQNQNESRPRIFSPRMDYDEWTPLGRGDPLKNNPTFDYVPPVLDRVQYWLDSQQHTTEPSSKRDILVLGVTAKKTSPKIPEQFLKFVDGPKFTRTSGQDAYRNDFTGSAGAEPPKILRTTNFRNGLVDYRNQNSLQSLPVGYYPSPYYNQKIKPYTMMMPPPMVPKAETSTGYNVGAYKDKLLGYVDASASSYSTQTEEGPVLQDTQYYSAPSKNYGYYSSATFSRPFSTSKTPPSRIEIVKTAPSASQSTRTRFEATTAPSVSFEKSNLIYQSTQTLSGGWLINGGPTSTGFPPANQVTWQTPDYSRDHYEVDHHAAASSNHEVVVGQNANIVVDVNGNENEEVVVGQKEISTEATPSTSESVTQTVTSTSMTSTTTMDSDDEEQEEEETVTDAQTSQKMHIVVANSPSTVADLETHKAKKGPVSVVLPTNYVERNSSASPPSSPPMTFHSDSAWDSTVTSEMTKTTHQTAKSQPQPVRNAVTSSPILTEDSRFAASSVPNRMLPPSQLAHQSPVSIMPSRHIGAGSSPHMFIPPQAAVSQSIMRPQSRPNHVMMHFIGSMRPGFRPSPPVSMSHMSPPMAHIHPQPMKNAIAPSPSMEQAHQRPPPQLFPVSFTNPPSTLGTQTTGLDEQQPIDHRLPATIVHSVPTLPPFVPTAPSAVEYTSTMGAHVEHRESSMKTDRSPLVKFLSAEETPRTTFAAPSSTTSAPRTTTAPSLTTDPIFSHYKQPAKPIRGPMYLIIQGHSKVKTYGPTIDKHDAPMENNEIAESATERQLSKLEQLIHDNAKNGGAVDLGAEKRKLEEKARAEKLHVSSRPETLMSLVESGLSGFTVSPATEDERRASNSVTSIEIN